MDALFSSEPLSVIIQESLRLDRLVGWCPHDSVDSQMRWYVTPHDRASTSSARTKNHHVFMSLCVRLEPVEG